MDSNELRERLRHLVVIATEESHGKLSKMPALKNGETYTMTLVVHCHEAEGSTGDINVAEDGNGQVTCLDCGKMLASGKVSHG